MLNQSDLLNASYEDIIFEDRNKAYGAYQLRTTYEKNLFHAMIIAFALILTLIVAPLISRLLAPATKHIDFERKIEPKTIVIELPPLNIKITPPEIKLPQIAQIKDVPPIIVEKVTKDEEIHTADEIKNAHQIGSTDQKGTDILNTAHPQVLAEILEEVELPPVLLAESMPSFPGGDKALFEFISRNIRYPQQALEYGFQGQVIVQFVVNKDGHITNPMILKDVKGGCGEEALRIINLMPNWNAGEQSGRKVSVFVRVPIKFRFN